MNQLSSITQRIQAPTPVFFKKLRSIGLLLAAVSATLLGMENIPDIITQIAGYLALAGGILSAVSQTAVEDTAKQQQEELPDEQS